MFPDGDQKSQDNVVSRRLNNSSGWAGSELFGKGLCLMSALITFINPAGDSIHDFRYWMRFPGTGDNPKCDNYVQADSTSTATTAAAPTTPIIAAATTPSAAPTPAPSISGAPGHTIGSLGSLMGALAIVFMQ